MVIVMRSGAGEDQVHAVIDRLNAFGFDVHRSSGLHRTVLGAIGSKPGFDPRHIASLEGVEAVHRVTAPYERVLADGSTADSVWTIGGRSFGRGRVAVIVSLPHENVRPDVVRAAVAAGADVLSVPVSDWATSDLAAAAGDVPVLLEVAHDGEYPAAGPNAAGYRLTGTAMFERNLVRGIAEAGVPVVLDRAPASTVEEWLMTADRLIDAGCANVALCDAGSRNLDPPRSLAPDIAALAFVRVRTRLPVIADPGRAIGDRDVALAAASAAVGAGAHGVVLALYDRGGSLDESGLGDEAARLRAVAASMR